jgi:hypothetical protein
MHDDDVAPESADDRRQDGRLDRDLRAAELKVQAVRRDARRRDGHRLARRLKPVSVRDDLSGASKAVRRSAARLDADLDAAIEKMTAEPIEQVSADARRRSALRAMRRSDRRHVMALAFIRVRGHAPQTKGASAPVGTARRGRGASGRPRGRSSRTAAASASGGGAGDPGPSGGRGSSDDGPGPGPAARADARRLPDGGGAWWRRWRTWWWFPPLPGTRTAGGLS